MNEVNKKNINRTHHYLQVPNGYNITDNAYKQDAII